MRSNLLEILLCVYLFSRSFVFTVWHPNTLFKLSCILESCSIANVMQLHFYVSPISTFRDSYIPKGL
jgi:hypothetical protein